MKVFSLGLLIMAALFGAGSASAATAYLLYDDGGEFHGCLNCDQFQSKSICNEFGTYGSQYNSDSIWNPYGSVGSKYNSNSPWSRYGKGLKIMDGDGGYYGRLSANHSTKDRINTLDWWFEYFETLDDLEPARKLVCKGA